nr:glycosyltransferase [Actinomycetota bacterium]
MGAGHAAGVTGTPGVSVIIPAYHSDGTIASCLEALRRQSTNGFEVIVVNSSPSDRTGAIVTERFPEVRYLASERRLLPHAARNVGAREARGDVLVFTDPDCEAAPDWIARLLAAQAEGHEVVVGSMDVADRDRFARGVHFVKYWWLLPGLAPGRRWIAPTANAAYSRRVWEEVGPFDDSMFASDGVMSWDAAHRTGHEPWFEPSARVHHRHPGGVGSLWRERSARGEEFAQVRMRREGWS